MSIRLGNTIIGGVATNTVMNAHTLLDFKWSDHRLNSMEWLDSTSFSWQSGDVYTSVYNLLVAEYQNGTTETEGNITFKRSPNGYKITTDEAGVSALFNETGVAWFYVLDTTNKRFKLPRTSEHGTVVSNIQNVTSWCKIYSDGWCEQGGLVSSSSSQSSPWEPVVSFPKEMSSLNYTLTFGDCGNKGANAHGFISVKTYDTTSATIRVVSSSGNFQYNNTFWWRVSGYCKETIQDSEHKYLYFYVGEFSQTATEQTAGLNTELFNTKADKDLSNINASSSAKKTIYNWSFPSLTWIDISDTSSGSTYTCPDRGFVAIRSQYAGTDYIGGYLRNERNGMAVTFGGSYTRGGGFMPVEKGDVITLTRGSNQSVAMYRFFYAKGEEE